MRENKNIATFNLSKSFADLHLVNCISNSQKKTNK